jgi:hypothetical protein
MLAGRLGLMMIRESWDKYKFRKKLKFPTKKIKKTKLVEKFAKLTIKNYFFYLLQDCIFLWEFK